MTSRDSGTQLPTGDEDEARSAELTTPNILRLLSAGASGTILMALGEAPLRTKELTERVPGYAPRTVYRYASKLAELGVIERYEETGVPSKVVHSLTEPSGRELHDLMQAYADASLPRLPSGDIGAHAWGSLGLLADLWESRMIEELNLGPRTATELARGKHGLSFHQVSRRASLCAIGGFIEETSEEARRRRYQLTDQARRAMALIAGIGRWRRRYVVPEGAAGLTAGEVSGLMQTALPLVVLPEHAGKSFELGIATPSGDEETLWANVGVDGRVLASPTPLANVDGSVRAELTIWVDSVLDGPHESLAVAGDASLISDYLHRLHAALWSPDDGQSLPVARPAPAAPGR
ncbi:MAG TPA: winged helix-turn-helix transcriptional regulator [Solirubrobacterales bacterium]|nr:winged helix-turn-helix transcriptional regulator [Solirubrobacterales bacterium]